MGGLLKDPAIEHHALMRNTADTRFKFTPKFTRQAIMMAVVIPVGLYYVAQWAEDKHLRYTGVGKSEAVTKSSRWEK
ncbi:hypothetical protein YB2330_005651 [Saitoella coloradoensis]